MKAFRFRAAAVLNLRRRQEDEARTTAARADATRRAADERVRIAEEALERGRTGLVGQQQVSTPAWLIGWHQSWMTRQRLDLQARRRDLSVATTAATIANAALRIAYRRRRVLERWRERAWRSYQLEARRHEARAMDLLAGLRYSARTPEPEGALSEHEQYR